MDFLDPKKERRNHLMLLLGYGLCTIAIAGATLVLLYQAYGFNLTRKGEVTQSGLLFVSSQPSSSAIYLNGALYKDGTNTRVTVAAGRYVMRISRSGYRDWERPVYVAGGDVQHFDYPLLVPKDLQTTSVASLNGGAPSLATQSPDHRWLLLDDPSQSGVFHLYDLKDPKQPVASQVTLSSDTFTAGDGAQSWSVEEWASDNRHVVLLHTYTRSGTTMREYIMVDHAAPSSSVNLTYKLNLPQNETLTLFNNRTAQLYVYNADEQTLRRVNVDDGSVVSSLSHVLAYKSYADNYVLYVTDQPPNGKATPGQVSVVLQAGQKTYTLRTLPASAPQYALNMAQYAGDWYVAAAASNDTAVYVYKNPQALVAANPDDYPAPWRRLQLNNPSYLSFSSNTQFLLAESGQQFITYDLENVAQYHYAASQPLDQPQTHAAWIDGDRLAYVSNGHLVMFDYDYRNAQTLQTAAPAYTPFFSGNYGYIFTLSADVSSLTRTSLLTPADQ